MKQIPPFRNRRDVFYLVHEEPTKRSKNGIYIVKPKDNSYRAIWAVVWDVPLKLMSTSDGYTKEEVDKIISTIKDYQKENDKLLENIKLEISKLNSEKADRTELANVVAGLVPMGSVANLTELEAKPKRNNDAYYVEDQLSPEGNDYIYRWDDGLSKWVNTKQVVFKDVITQGLGDSSNKAMSQKAVTDKITQLAGELKANISSVTCDTAGDVSEKILTVPNFQWSNGNFILFVKFQYANTADDVTLNINGLGAKPLFLYNTRVNSTTSWIVGKQYCIFKSIWYKNELVMVDTIRESTGTFGSDPHKLINQQFLTQLLTTIPVCSSISDSSVKEVSIPGYTNAIGQYHLLRFKYANTADDVTLNINGLGAKPLFLYNTRVSAANTWKANYVLLVCYIGGEYLSASIFDDDILKLQNDLKNGLKNVWQGLSAGQDIFNSSYIRKNDGVVNRYTPDAKRTDYIDISMYSYLIINAMVVPLNSPVGNAFYSEKSEESFIVGFGHNDSNVLGYKKLKIKIPEGAKYVRCSMWNETVAPGNEISERFYIFGDPISTMNDDDDIYEIISLPKTTYIATTRNFILKEESIEGVNYLMHSNDLGNSWVSVQNTIGNIVFVHWFTDGTCLIAGNTKVYYTKDWITLNESDIYDLNGSIFVGDNKNFFSEFYYNSKYTEINGVESLVWGDYGGPTGYISRTWITQDNGKTIKCILKSGESILDGAVLSIRHFHHCVWDNYDNCLWITTGDSGSQCHLIKGIYSNNSWQFTKLASGDNFKFGQILFDEEYLYLITDYTTGTYPTGIIGVSKENVSDINSYFYVFKDELMTPYTQYYEDSNGHRILGPDGLGFKKLWYAYKDFNFVQKEVQFEGGLNLSLGFQLGPNYNGDLITIAFTGYDVTDLKWNTSNRFLFSEGMRAAGYKDFAKNSIFNKATK